MWYNDNNKIKKRKSDETSEDKNKKSSEKDKPVKKGPKTKNTAVNISNTNFNSEKDDTDEKYDIDPKVAKDLQKVCDKIEEKKRKKKEQEEWERQCEEEEDKPKKKKKYPKSSDKKSANSSQTDKVDTSSEEEEEISKAKKIKKNKKGSRKKKTTKAKKEDNSSEKSKSKDESEDNKQIKNKPKKKGALRKDLEKDIDSNSTNTIVQLDEDNNNPKIINIKRVKENLEPTKPNTQKHKRNISSDSGVSSNNNSKNTKSSANKSDKSDKKELWSLGCRKYFILKFKEEIKYTDNRIKNFINYIWTSKANKLVWIGVVGYEYTSEHNKKEHESYLLVEFKPYDKLSKTPLEAGKLTYESLINTKTNNLYMMVLSGLYNPYNNPTYKRTYLSGQHAVLPGGAEKKIPANKSLEKYLTKALIDNCDSFIANHTINTIIEENNILATSNSIKSKEDVEMKDETNKFEENKNNRKEDGIKGEEDDKNGSKNIKDNNNDH